MNKTILKSAGFSLVEVILAIGLFGIFATGLLGLIYVSYDSDLQAEQKDVATLYAQEGIEATWSIRRQAWNLLENGDHGVTTTNGYWEFLSTSDVLEDFYTRVITISDACRDSGGDLIDCDTPGAIVDVYTKLATSVVSYTAITGVGNSVTLNAYLTNWQDEEWIQTNWVGGSGQGVWSDSTQYDSDDSNIDSSTSGEVKLSSAGGLGCGTKQWPFSTPGDYVVSNASEIEVANDNARLVSSGGGLISGDTVNDEFTSNDSSWSFDDWGVGGGEVTPTGAHIASGGNTGGYVNINIPYNARNDEVGGYWEQPITVTEDGVDATCSFDWSVTEFNVSRDVDDFQFYVFLDNFSGPPSIGNAIWSSGLQDSTTAWSGIQNIDCSSSVTTAGTYYYKIAIWLEADNRNTGPITVGYDNAKVHWESPSTPYSINIPSVNPLASYDISGVEQWSSFTETASKDGGEIYYQLSDDDGSTWYYWDGISWSVAGATDYNTAAVVNANIKSFSVANEQIVFKAFLESDGTQNVQLDQVEVTCSKLATWSFSTPGDYTLSNSSEIEVASDNAQLISSGGGVISGETLNDDFTSNSSNWSFDSWGVFPGTKGFGAEVTPTGNYVASGGNTGGYVNIEVPSNASNDEIGGYWEQSITVTENDVDATCSFDWNISQWTVSGSVDDFRLYVFLDNYSGAPSLGNAIWSSGFQSGVVPWSGIQNIDCSSSVTTAGTYYYKIAIWLEAGSGATGPITIGYDNAKVSWDKTPPGSYPTTNPTVNPTTSYSSSGVEQWSSFTETASKDGGEIYYQLSDDDGSTWYYWDGASWNNAGVSNYNTASVVDDNISIFSTSTNSIMFKAFLESNGSQNVQLDQIQISWSGGSAGGGGYASSGYLLSSAFDMSDSSAVNTISWQESIPVCTPTCTIKLQIRTAPDNTGSPGSWTDWYGSSGAGTYFVEPSGSVVSSDFNFNQWVQYRAELTGDGIDTPILEEVIINYLP